MGQLLSPVALPARGPDAAALKLSNRIVMAPMTRCFAGDGLVPTDEMAEYYARRATAGLLVSEATLVSREGQGYPHTPGLFTDEQTVGWKRVTERVHMAGGRIFCQLWHTGRAAHSAYTKTQPIGPTARGMEGTLPRRRRLHFQTPRPMTLADIERVCGDFRAAAVRAEEAGFDGVEIHGANGYLIDQFLHYSVNDRHDAYGGSPENMARFALELVDAVLSASATQPVAIRLSPAAHVQLDGDSRDAAVFRVLLAELSERQLCYLHLGHSDDQSIEPLLGWRPSEFLRRHYRGLVMGAGKYTPALGEQAITEGRVDLVAFGRAFIANPDLVQRLSEGRALDAYDPITLMQLA